MGCEYTGIDVIRDAWLDSAMLGVLDAGSLGSPEILINTRRHRGSILLVLLLLYDDKFAGCRRRWWRAPCRDYVGR